MTKNENKLPISEWLTQKNIVANVAPILYQTYSSALFMHVIKKAFIDESFDPSLEQERWPTEMGLCGAVHSLKLPDGFRVVSGAVQVPKHISFETKTRKISHTFGFREDHTILCITFGQFYNPHKVLQPGERVSYFQTLAPDIISVYPGQNVAVMLGEAKIIQRRLGLKYIVE